MNTSKNDKSMERSLEDAIKNVTSSVVEMSEDKAEIAQYIVHFIGKIQEMMIKEEGEEEEEYTLPERYFKNIRMYLGACKVLLEKNIIPTLEEQDYT